MHIFDFRWEESSSRPYFEICAQNALKKKELSIGEKFSITLVDETQKCTGAKIKGEYRPCPDNFVGSKKCEKCKKAEDYFPCQFCNGFNCSRFREEKIENCDSDHMVYLALFDTDLVKVGVSRVSRGKARQFEQGSHFTRVFAKGMSGVMARRIETTLIKSGFPDKIPATRKKNILFPELSLEEGKSILEEKYNFAQDQIISLMPEMKKFLVENEFWDMRSFYAEFVDVLKEYALLVHIETLEEGESVSGDLVMVKGSFLVINTKTELVVILAKNLVGKDVSFDECEIGITKNGGFQGGLF
jgi:hypothetical protein